LNKNLNRIKITPEKVTILIDFLTDPDIEINHQAKLLLTNLSIPESQIAFLEFYIKEMPAVMTPLLPLINFKTKRQDLLAMAYFMAEDWQNYEILDFNQQFLSIYFYNADDSTRRNILTKLQRSGKPQFTNIIIQNNLSNRQKLLNYSEVQTSISLLQQYENWPALWELCQNTYLDLSLKIFITLRNKDWSPQDATERELYSQLLKLELPDSIPSLKIVINDIPFAIPISKLRFRGRINDVAFASHEKILAMATNQRAVLLWNYNQGKAEQLIRGFNHSIGLLNYSDKDQLFIGEKTNGQDLCDVWRWSEQRLSLIGFHQGSITSIHSIQNDLLITTGKDKRLVAWNPNTKSAINETKLGWWPRASFYHTDTKTISLFNTFRIELSVPEFKYQPYQFVQSNPAVRTSVERDIRVLPKTKEILIGQNNGQIVLNQYNHDKKFYQQLLIHQMPSNLIGLTNTTGENEFMAVGKDGKIHLFDLFGKVKTLHHQVSNNFTSFQISPDRTLFATGTKTAETLLWDLRPNQIKVFLQHPISEISNSQWVVLKFIENQKNLEKNTKTIIRYCNRLLEHRYKFDIELASIDELSPGEFDIELEQVYGK
jgi:WD40 repeat protein